MLQNIVRLIHSELHCIAANPGSRQLPLDSRPVPATDLARIYDDKFFREYGAANPRYADACSFIATEIYRRFQPRTAIDWGCGAGLHAAELGRLGVDVIAVDAVVAADELRAGGIDIRRADLTEPLPFGFVPDTYDLSLCVDVMEHLHEADADIALDNITQNAELVILSCAPPGQGGHHHVNEQPRRYWVARMAARGWRYDRRATGSMENYFLGHRDQLPLSWMYHNLCIYRRA